MAKIKAPKIWHTGQCVPSLGARAIVFYVSVHGHRVLSIGARANDSLVLVLIAWSWSWFLVLAQMF